MTGDSVGGATGAKVGWNVGGNVGLKVGLGVGAKVGIGVGGLLLVLVVIVIPALAGTVDKSKEVTLM